MSPLIRTHVCTYRPHQCSVIVQPCHGFLLVCWLMCCATSTLTKLIVVVYVRNVLLLQNLLYAVRAACLWLEHAAVDIEIILNNVRKMNEQRL